MVDHIRVCCLCGDVGFPDKLFQCARCLSRFQHSYCSNYYNSSDGGALCDWCRGEEVKLPKKVDTVKSREFSHGKRPEEDTRGELTKQRGVSELGDGNRKKASNGAGSSTRPTARRYKLLKDVLC
ncbi:uncharacterized protein LOC144712502 [Wolffia australiana]